MEYKKIKDSGGGILFLTNNENSLVLYKWILEQGYSAVLYNEPLTIKYVCTLAPSLIISYNYNSIIKKDVIEYMKGRIINLHISFLPWNRGAHPNFWSFVEGSPKGVTIHQIDEGLDTGHIIYQKEVNFDISEETFVSSYQKLQMEITHLFRSHWKEIYNGDYRLTPQEGEGSYHSTSDLRKLKSKMSFEWEDNIAETVMRYKNIELC